MSLLEEKIPASPAFQSFVLNHLADQYRRDIMTIAEQQDLGVDTVVLALADSLGITAAMLDKEIGRRTLKDKLHSFCRRVEETYEQVMSVK